MQDLQDSGEAVGALEERRDLPPDLSELMRLYEVVSAARPPAFAGVAGIRITDIEAVYRLCEVKMMPADEFLSWMQWLDSVVRDWYTAKAAKEKKPNG